MSIFLGIRDISESEDIFGDCWHFGKKGWFLKSKDIHGKQGHFGKQLSGNLSGSKDISEIVDLFDMLESEDILGKLGYRYWHFKQSEDKSL